MGSPLPGASAWRKKITVPSNRVSEAIAEPPKSHEIKNNSPASRPNRRRLEKERQKQKVVRWEGGLGRIQFRRCAG